MDIPLILFYRATEYQIQITFAVFSLNGISIPPVFAFLTVVPLSVVKTQLTQSSYTITRARVSFIYVSVAFAGLAKVTCQYNLSLEFHEIYKRKSVGKIKKLCTAMYL